MSVSRFMDHNFRHFNARETLEAARAWKEFCRRGGKMLMCIAGAMSTAEIGLTLARLIRKGFVHAISSTAANFEEDLFNLMAHDEYRMVPHYRDLSPEDEVRLRDEGYNRVTDTCIPETVMRHMAGLLEQYWQEACAQGEQHFHYEYVYRLVQEPLIEQKRQIPREHSWVCAAQEMNLPIWTPGWEDSTLGNMFAARVIRGVLPHHNCVKNGTQQMEKLVRWYLEHESQCPLGFFQIGGGIAGDFAICTVPLILQDMEQQVSLWSYFCQISDSTTSYGSYSGAVPNEKITWCKLEADSPKFMINSDASIVAPLIFAYLLDE